MLAIAIAIASNGIFFVWDNWQPLGPIWRKILRFKPKHEDIFECFEAATNPMDDNKTRGALIGDVSFCGFEVVKCLSTQEGGNRDPTHTSWVGGCVGYSLLYHALTRRLRERASSMWSEARGEVQ